MQWPVVMRNRIVADQGFVLRPGIIGRGGIIREREVILKVIYILEVSRCFTFTCLRRRSTRTCHGGLYLM